MIRHVCETIEIFPTVDVAVRDRPSISRLTADCPLIPPLLPFNSHSFLHHAAASLSLPVSLFLSLSLSLSLISASQSNSKTKGKKGETEDKSGGKQYYGTLRRHPCTDRTIVLRSVKQGRGECPMTYSCCLTMSLSGISVTSSPSSRFSTFSPL